MYLCFYKGKGENRSVGLAADLQEKIEDYGIEVTGMEVQVEDCMLAADEKKSYLFNFDNNNEDNKSLKGDHGAYRSGQGGFISVYGDKACSGNDMLYTRRSGVRYERDAADMDDMTYDMITDTLRLQRYAVIVASEELFAQLDKLVELDVLRRLFTDGEVMVFTVMNMKEGGSCFPEREKWLEQTFLMQCYNDDDVCRAAARIAKIYWRDMLAADCDVPDFQSGISAMRHKRCIDTVLSHYSDNMPGYKEELSAMRYCMLDMMKNL